MSDLDDLAEAATTSPARPRYRTASLQSADRCPDRVGQMATGFFFALGAVPLLVVGIVVAFLICEAIVKEEISDAMQEVRNRLNTPAADRPTTPASPSRFPREQMSPP